MQMIIDQKNGEIRFRAQTLLDKVRIHRLCQILAKQRRHSRLGTEVFNSMSAAARDLISKNGSS